MPDSSSSNMDPNATSVEDQLPGLGAKVLEACPEVHDLETGGPLYHPHACQLEEHCR